MSERQHKQEPESGILECVGCGKRFKLTDGESVYIDHFGECDG